MQLSDNLNNNPQSSINRAYQQKRAILYLRVSSEAQEKDGESLDYQEEKCRQYAELQGYEVIFVLKEVQSGYIHYSHRQKLTLARQMIKDGDADVIVVWDLSRFSRNFVHSALIFEEIEQAGGSIESVSERIDNSLNGKLIRSLMAWCAESERHRIVAYANRNWQTRLEQGLPIGCGSKPYGWDWGDKKKTFYVINRDEAAVRLAIYHLFLNESMSLRAIERKLNEDGIAPPCAPIKAAVPRWSASTIREILVDERNIGVLTICKWKKTTRNNGKRGVQPNNPNVKKIQGGIPAIISVEAHEQAKAKLALNKIEKSNMPKEPERFLLRGGHIYCKACGFRMAAKTRIRKNKKGEYTQYSYDCSARHHRICQAPTSILTGFIDEPAWEECCKLFQRAEKVQKILEQAIDYEVGNIHGEDKIEEKIIQLQAGIEKAYREREREKEGSYLYNLITEDLHKKNITLQALEEEKKQTKPLEVRASLYKQKVLNFINFLTRMKGRYHEASYKQKRNALAVLGVKVYLGRIPNENGSRYEIQFSPRFSEIAPEESGLRCHELEKGDLAGR